MAQRRRPRFEVFRDEAGKEWWWRLVGANGEKVAGSGEGFPSLGHARRAVRRCRQMIQDDEVVYSIKVVDAG